MQQRTDGLIQLLDLQPQVDMGNDDLIFGNYVKFPPASQINPDLFPDVLEMLALPLPFDGAVDVSSLRWLRNLTPSLRSLVLVALGQPSALTTGAGYFLLEFPNLDAESEETLELVNYLLPPAVYEHDLPADHQYWRPDPEDLNSDPNDELLALCRSRPVALDKLVSEIESLRREFDDAQTLIVQKAILLACFSLVESFTRQRALLNAPRFPESPSVEELILRLVRREVQDDTNRTAVMKALEPGKAWGKQIPEWKLRNALAHDIGAVTIDGKTISFEHPARVTQTRSIEKVFDDLIRYANANLA